MHTPDHRQVLMEEWHRELIASGRAEEESVEAYAPHADFLRSLSGRVLDVGGGCGLAARHLAREVDYFVVEPSTLWTSPEWSNLSRWFCRNGPTPKIISA